MKRLFNYWQEFFVDLKIWWRYRKAARGSEELLVKNNMRVDWLGRIYTVINMPEEVVNNQEMVQQGWVISQLRPFSDVLMQIGLSDYAYPEITRVSGANSYLIVMYPEIDALNPWRMLWNFFITGFLLWGVYALVMSLYNMHEIRDMVKQMLHD